jgi:hypothetical protein
MRPQSVARYISFLVGWCYEQEGLTAPTARGHDVRKVATALRELNSTSLSELLKAGSWATPGVFLKHYKLLVCPSAAELSRFEGLPVAKSVLSLQKHQRK